MKLALTTLCLLSLTGASAAPIVYYANLDGPSEAPPNASPGTGLAIVTVDADAHTMRVQAWFSGLTSGTTAAHIHCCTTAPFTAGVATSTPRFLGFPTGVTSGTYGTTLDLTSSGSWNSSFIAAQGSISAAEAALLAAMADGRTYFNIHTTNFPGGEIRGFLQPAPEPATFGLLGAAFAGLMFARRRSRPIC